MSVHASDTSPEPQHMFYTTSMREQTMENRSNYILM